MCYSLNECASGSRRIVVAMEKNQKYSKLHEMALILRLKMTWAIKYSPTPNPNPMMNSINITKASGKFQTNCLNLL